MAAERSERPARPFSNLTRLRRSSDVVRLFAFSSFALLCAGLVSSWPDLMPPSIFAIPLVIGGLYLGPRHLPWFVIGLLTVLLVAVAGDRMVTGATVVSVAVVFVLALVELLTSFRRSRLGVSGPRGESMLVDLRDRIQSQGMLPALPASWYAETALRSAGGTPFAGDFVVAARPDHGRRLELAVVDVSGKGEDAGTRSLLLSGAFSGLLGALPPEDFLPAANDYLLRQNWSEGFATAIHFSLDLDTGDFEIRTAGHPPAVQLDAGTGRWGVHHPDDGTALGIVDDAVFPAVCGRMRRGDAVLLYTDGMVETRSRDIGLGIDKLTGQAERLLRNGFEDGARRLIDRLGSRSDDRALLLLHRR